MLKKKINSNGITLAELIVSISLVAVASVYFYQTIYTVSNLYRTSNEDVIEYIDKNFAYRVIDAYVESLNGNFDNFCELAKQNLLVKDYFNNSCEDIKFDAENNIIYIKFNINNNKYELIKYIKKV